MPTVKTQGGKVITKDGKVSCSCCVPSCNFSTQFANEIQIEITRNQYLELFAAGTIVSNTFTATSSASAEWLPCYTTNFSGTYSESITVTKPQRCTTWFDEVTTRSVGALPTVNASTPGSGCASFTRKRITAPNPQTVRFSLYTTDFGQNAPHRYGISIVARFTAGFLSVTEWGLNIVRQVSHNIIRTDSSATPTETINFVLDSGTIAIPAIGATDFSTVTGGAPFTSSHGGNWITKPSLTWEPSAP